MINYKNILITRNSTIIQALYAIDKGDCKTAFIVDGMGRLIGSITDGDIRRALIAERELSDEIGPYINVNPLVLTEGYSKKKAHSIMENNVIGALPVVNSQNAVIDVIRLHDLYQKQHNTPVIIMAGGLGSRMGSLVSEVPKPMLEIAGEPILLKIINNFKKFGFNNIHISVNYKSDIIESFFGNGDDFGVSITYIRENKRLGTGGSIKLCVDTRDNVPIIVINGDVLTNANIMDMLNFHISNQFDMTVGTVSHDINMEFGVLEIENNIVKRIVEKPTYRYMLNGGIYCLNSSVKELIPNNEYFNITSLIDKNINVGSYLINDYWIDIGKISQYNKAQEDYREIFNNQQ